METLIRILAIKLVMLEMEIQASDSTQPPPSLPPLSPMALPPVTLSPSQALNVGVPPGIQVAHRVGHSIPPV